MGKQILEIGRTASFAKTITEYDIYTFAGVTGDFNSVHINEEEAKKSAFGRRIAHGMLTGGLISAVLGNKLPGEGTVYGKAKFPEVGSKIVKVGRWQCTGMTDKEKSDSSTTSYEGG